jgi:hypothetical protein
VHNLVKNRRKCKNKQENTTRNKECLMCPHGSYSKDGIKKKNSEVEGEVHAKRKTG